MHIGEEGLIVSHGGGGKRDEHDIDPLDLGAMTPNSIAKAALDPIAHNG